MAKPLYLAFLCLLISSFAFSQNRSITGTVIDNQSKTPLQGASVRLRSATDSSFGRSMLSDSSGTFMFSGLMSDSFLLNISYVGYNDINRNFRIDTSDLQFDIAAAPSSSGELETVVIRTSITPVTQKGDTLQMNASQYKVNPDASAEDLIQKMPGLTVENGQVKAQGENVQKVTIDGRDLFGDDATAALRNLPAEIIDKIQVFDRLSDQAQFTGVDDGNTSKAINIVTKANMRNGQFGRIFAGYGTDERYSAGGNATFLHENRKISIVGNFNNINQQNFSQQDLLGVTSSSRGGSSSRGSSSRSGSSRSGRDGGSFGSSNNFLVGSQDGINRTNSFGVNYADVLSPKVSLSGSYFFNNSKNTTYQLSNTQYLTGSIANIIDTTTSTSNNTNHRVNMRLEWKIDSSNQLMIMPNLSWQNNSSQRVTSSNTYYNPEAPTTRTFNRNSSSSDRSGNNLNNSLYYRHAFAKRGRSFSVGLNTSYNKRNGDTYVDTYANSLDSSGMLSDTASNRFTDQISDVTQLSGSLNYTEPLSENAQLQFSYNPSYSKSTSTQETFLLNPTDGKYNIFQNNLSNVFENTTRAQNGGLSYRYGNRDRSISVGVNYQHTQLNSERVLPFQTSVDKSFNNVLPYAVARYKLNDRNSFRLYYRAQVNQPSVTQLQDVLDITGAPSYSLGSPDLNQQYSHSLSTQYTFTNTSKGIVFVGNLYLLTANNYIANAQYNGARDTVIGNVTLPAGYRLTQPVNLDGYTSLRSFFTFAVPLKFIKSNLNLNWGVSHSNLPGLVNKISTTTKNTSYSLGAVIGSNVSEYVDFTVTYNASFSDADIASGKTVTNNRYFQHLAGLSMNLLSKSGWFLQNQVNNQFYSGLSAGFNQNFLLWNAGIGKKFLEGNKGELKLSVYDLLKQNQAISRTVDNGYIQDVQSQILQRYFMLTFTYNLRNFGTAAARASNRMERERGGDGPPPGGMRY